MIACKDGGTTLSSETTTTSNMATKSVTTKASAAPRAKGPLLKVTSNPNLDQQANLDRRRTLQTISELSPPSGTPAWNGIPTKSSGNGIAYGSIARHSGPIGVKSNRRKSLPNQSAGSDPALKTKPSITVTPADAPELQRSFTDPSDQKHLSPQRSFNGSKGAKNGNPKRLSINSSLRTRQDPQLSPVAEGGQPESKGSSDKVNSQPQEATSNGSEANQPMRPDDGKVRQGEGWNARRERERIKREQAVVDATARREREGRAIAIGSSSTLPSLSPFPVVKAREIQIKRHDSQQQLHPNSQIKKGNHSQPHSDRRASYSQAGSHASINNINVHKLKRASTGGYQHGVSQPNGIQRSYSAASEPFWVHAVPVNPNLPQTLRPVPSRSFSSPNPYQLYPPISSSLKPSPNSTRASSMRSNGSGSSTPKNQSRPSSSHARAPTGTIDSQAYQNANGGRLEVFPPLANVPSLPNYPPFQVAPGSQQAVQARQSRRHSQGSQVSQTSRRRSNTQQSQRSRSHSRPRSVQSAMSDPNSIIHRENPDKRGLPAAGAENVRLLREREKLVRWKAEREKAEFDAREKIKERVRRANELEEEKEKELLKEAKKKNRRSFFCGLFG